MTQVAHFLVDPRLTALLGETYRSSEIALKELVDNAWDADADNVWISLPAAMSSDPVVIKDDGTGMTAAELRGEYLKIASDKRARTGDRTRRLGRKIKGRKGIGKFAGLTLASQMTISTAARDRLSTLTISREELVNLDIDLEAVPLRFSEHETDKPSGTVITLRQLRPSLNFPTSERLREVLVMEYGREDSFRVFVDGIPLSVDDIPGPTSAREADLPRAGKSSLTFTISDGKNPKTPGIIVKVNGKSVGKPQFFGLEEDDEVPTKLLRRLYGEVCIDGAEEHVTADWGALIENSKITEDLREFVSSEVKVSLKEAHASTMNLQKARLQLEIKRRLEKLPEHRREYAHRALQLLILKYYEENLERVEIIVEVALDAMEHDAYWVVIEGIKLASDQDVFALALSLNQFGLVELSSIAGQATRRLTFLDYIERLVNDSVTLEQQLHTALETNFWVLGRSYSLLASNVTLRSIVDKYCTPSLQGDHKSDRPDLLLTEDFGRRYLLIEFKRPSMLINRDHVSQAEKYRDHLRSKLPDSPQFNILLIGKGLTSSIDPHSLPSHVRVQSYLGAISAARSEMNWLLKSLSQPT